MNEEDEKNKRGQYAQGYSVEDLVGSNFGERYQNRELGKESIDTVIQGLENNWNDLDDGVKQNIVGTANFITNAYKEARSISPDEKYNPIAYVEAGAVRGIEGVVNTIGKVSDFVIGNPARGLGWLGGLDPRAQEAMSVAAQLYLGPKALKGLTKLKPKNLGITQTIEKINTVDDVIPPKQMFNITSDVIDETVSLNPEIFRRASRIYKKNPSIGMKKAIEEAKLLEGFTPSQLITDKTFGSIKKGGLFDPNRDDTTKLMFAGGMDLGLGDTGFSYSVKKKQSVGEYRNKLFNEAGFRRNENGDFVFNLESLLNFQKGEKRRLISQVAQTREGQTVINSFAKTKNATLLDFSETYGGYMLMTGSKPNLHHEFAAMVSAPLYDGMALSETPGSDWMRVTELLNANNIYPGSPVTDTASLGGDQSNLTQMLTKGRKGAPPEPHDILHHQFYKEMRLQDVDKGKASFWAQRAYKMNTIEGRLEVAQEYADIVNEGNRIIKSAMGQINALFGRTTDPELMVELLSEIAKTGKLKIIGTDYRLKSVESIVKIIKKEVMANLPLADEQDVINQVAKYQLSFDNEIDAIDLLHDIADFNTSMRVYGTRPPSITLKKHKENVAAYMELIQGKLDLNTDLNAKTQAVSEFTYTRVNPQPINKQLELLFPEPKPEQLELLKKENPLLE